MFRPALAHIDTIGIPACQVENFRCHQAIVQHHVRQLQQPGGLGGSSGGQREFVPVLARAATAVGVAGLFMETHQDPDNAPSDGPNMVPIHEMPALLEQLAHIDKLIKQ